MRKYRLPFRVATTSPPRSASRGGVVSGRGMAYIHYKNATPGDRPRRPARPAAARRRRGRVEPVPAALANAVFDATGVRLRSVPLGSARSRALLA
jgi:hypothetical protein